ncbi:hypothetical protein IJ182_01915 [bacterium]|nr:hypothetical protein [bacterium]
MKVNSVNSTNVNPVKTITKAIIGAGAAAIALAAAHKTDSFTKVAGKLGDKSEAVKPVLNKLDEAGKIILDKATGLASTVKAKATELGVDKKAAEVADNAKKAGKGVIAKVQDGFAAVTEKIQHPEKFSPSKVSADELQKLADEMGDAATKF